MAVWILLKNNESPNKITIMLVSSIARACAERWACPAFCGEGAQLWVPGLMHRFWLSSFDLGCEFPNRRAAQASWGFILPTPPLWNNPVPHSKGQAQKPGLSLPHSTIFRNHSCTWMKRNSPIYLVFLALAGRKKQMRRWECHPAGCIWGQGFDSHGATCHNRGWSRPQAGPSCLCCAICGLVWSGKCAMWPFCRLVGCLQSCDDQVWRTRWHRWHWKGTTVCSR